MTSEVKGPEFPGNWQTAASSSPDACTEFADRSSGDRIEFCDEMAQNRDTHILPESPSWFSCHALVTQDVRTGENWVKGAWDLAVLPV